MQELAPSSSRSVDAHDPTDSLCEELLFEEHQPQHWFTIFLSPKGVHSPPAKESNRTQRTPEMNPAQSYVYKQTWSHSFQFEAGSCLAGSSEQISSQRC